MRPWTRGGVSVALVWLASCAGRSQGDDSSTTAGAPGSGTGGAAGHVGTGGSGGGSAGSSSGSGGRGGSSAGASTVAGQGASGGSAGSTGGSAVEAGAGGERAGSGGSGGHELLPCNSSNGSGCAENEVCLDDESDTCWPVTGTDCSGYCAELLPPSGCETLSQCTGTVTCPALPGTCPSGQVQSIVDDCYGPCVPVDCCACATDFDCQLSDATCDAASGRCVVPAAPEPRCLLPFDAGPCDGAQRVFAYVGEHCEERVYGLCDGNDNRFATLEECLRRCEGMPQEHECPPDRSPQVTCLACGAGGGCVETATVCAKACEAPEDCDQGLACSQGFCGVNFCL